MHTRHYIRNLMIDRISGEGISVPIERMIVAHDGVAGDSDRRRFRRMAENRKRQILERMLLDNSAAGESDPPRDWRHGNHAR